MPKLQFFKQAKLAFDALATEDGFIGHPQGEIAYAYVRVSSEEQAEDNRSGLARQIEHIHEAANSHRRRITWDLVFADDFTGFQFEDRPALSKLRREYKSGKKRATAVFMEHIDRLSRNADWMQGYLEYEMKQHGVEPIYWKKYSSRIERAVMGAISQEGMEQAKERMVEGMLKKAKRGRITARFPAFGYKLVDQNGNVGTKEAREETYYAINEEQSDCVRYMFEALAYEGLSCRQLLMKVDERAKTDPRFRPPRARAWNERTFCKMIRNPLYKGEFIAHRHYREWVSEFDERGMPKKVLKNRQRPEEEWIRVAVPAIVDEETWEMANRNLYRNQLTATKNKKNHYLLSPLIRCATCGRRYNGQTESTKSAHIQRYLCVHVFYRPAVRQQKPCNQKSIHCSVLDAAVWDVLTQVLLQPDLIQQAIDARYANERVDNIREQIAFLERSLAGKGDEERKLYEAYLAEAYNAKEYALERQSVMKERETLQAEIEHLQGQVMTPEELADKKRSATELVTQTQKRVNIHNAPFEYKQQITRLLVDEIILNVNEGWFEIKGEVGAGVYHLGVPGSDDDMNGDSGSANIRPRISLKSTRPSIKDESALRESRSEV